MLGTAERRYEIMRLLCRRRSETIRNMASEFGVSERTIRRDIEVLSLTEPIYTQYGRYGGGVYVVNSYSGNRTYMSEKELSVLHKLYKMAEDQHRCVLTEEELSIFKSVIVNYTKPIVMKGDK